MSNPAPTTEQAVTALLSERQRYESWLGTLEARRTSTPQHIYTRVHADYAARLQRVLEQLSTHRAAIQGMVDSLAERLSALEAEEARHRDERAEAELRALVGEYAPEESETLLRRGDEELARLSAEKAGVAADLSRYRALIEAGALGARPAAGRPAVTTPPSAPATADSSRPDLQRHSGVYGERVWDVPEEPAAPSVTGAADRARTSFDELEFLKSVVDARQGSHTAPQGMSAGNSSGSAAGQGATTTSVTPTTGESPTGGREMRESIPSFLKDVPPEQVKTLKCQECGTLNYPTEWYCERCGAELAAL